MRDLPVLIVNYHQRAKTVPSDHRVQKDIDDWIDHYKAIWAPNILNIYVNSSIQILAFRVAIVEGRIDYRDIKFRHKKQDIIPSPDGSLSEWPDGFADTIDKMLHKLMERRISINHNRR